MHVDVTNSYLVHSTGVLVILHFRFVQLVSVKLRERATEAISQK